jgi:hypothetical protein
MEIQAAKVLRLMKYAAESIQDEDVLAIVEVAQVAIEDAKAEQRSLVSIEKENRQLRIENAGLKQQVANQTAQIRFWESLPDKAPKATSS